MDLQGLLKRPWIQLLSLCSHSWNRLAAGLDSEQRGADSWSLFPSAFSLALSSHCLLCPLVSGLFLTFKSQRFGLSDTTFAFWLFLTSFYSWGSLSRLYMVRLLAFEIPIQLARQGRRGCLEGTVNYMGRPLFPDTGVLSTCLFAGAGQIYFWREKCCTWQDLSLSLHSLKESMVLLVS